MRFADHGRLRLCVLASAVWVCVFVFVGCFRVSVVKGIFVFMGGFFYVCWYFFVFVGLSVLVGVSVLVCVCVVVSASCVERFLWVCGWRRMLFRVT